MNVSKGDAVTYGALVTAAVMQAADPWRKEAAVPPDMHPILSSSVWSYAPLALLILVGAIWLFRQFYPQKAAILPSTSHSPSGEIPFDRIPVTELLKMATDRGWNFTTGDSLHLIDLQKAIRQGASDSQITVWGRLNKWSNNENLVRNEILEKIPHEHWRAFYVHLFPALDGDNFHTKSWTPSETPKNYLDLHVNRPDAVIWLDRDAVTFKGKTTYDQRGMP
jgi:hypothetical protein